jgi:glycerol kinase
VETTAMGAAYLAGLAVGYWANTDEIRQNWAIERTFSPEITEENRTARIKGWKKAVSRVRDWAK